jgi:outer membrane protein assembly factor BamB
VVGVAATAQQLRALAPDGTERWRLTLEPSAGAGGKAVRHAPAVGTTAIWAGADDGRLYGAALDGGAVLTSCSGGVDVEVYTPALRSAPEVAFAGTGSTAPAQLVAASTAAGAVACDRAATLNQGSASPVLAAGALLAPTTSLISEGALVRFVEAGTQPGALTRDWSVRVGRTQAAPSVTGDGKVVLGGRDGHVYLVDAAAAAPNSSDLLGLAGAPDGSAVVGAGGDLFLGTNDGGLHRLVRGAGGAWSDAWVGATVGAPVAGVALASRDASGVFLYSVTSTAGAGEVQALAEVGGRPVAVWATSGLAAGALQPPVLVPPPAGAPASQLATLYVGSGDGHLYALVVDTGLDVTAPWPKAHHDLRNTGNAAAALP